MKTLTILLGAAAGTAATIFIGAAVAAAARDVVGQTYNDAKNTIQSTGAAVLIVTKTGGRADQEICIVTDVWDKPSVTEPRQRRARTRCGSR
jgi:hypothetical protein